MGIVLEYTTAHANTDALSRLPLQVEPATAQTPPELVLLADHLPESPVTATQIRFWTRKDPELAIPTARLAHIWHKWYERQVSTVLFEEV